MSQKTRRRREKSREDLLNLAYGLALAAAAYTFLRTGSWVITLILLGGFAGALAGLLALVRHRRMNALRNSDIERIDQTSGEAFEEVLLALFRGLGYRAELTPNGADYGADLVLERSGERTAVPAQR